MCTGPAMRYIRIVTGPRLGAKRAPENALRSEQSSALRLKSCVPCSQSKVSPAKSIQSQPGAHCLLLVISHVLVRWSYCQQAPATTPFEADFLTCCTCRTNG